MIGFFVSDLLRADFFGGFLLILTLFFLSKKLIIVRALAPPKVKWADGIDPAEYLAPQTEGYSAADLYAVMNTAQLSAIFERLAAVTAAAESAEPSDLRRGGGAPVVTAGHLEAALQRSHASVSREERAYLEQRYRTFGQEGTAGIPSSEGGEGEGAEAGEAAAAPSGLGGKGGLPQRRKIQMKATLA